MHLERLTTRSLTASCLLHLAAISGLAAWSASSHVVSPKFAGQNAAIELIVTRAESTWSPEPVTFEYTTIEEVPVTVEPTKAMIARKIFEQVAATEPLFDSIASETTLAVTHLDFVLAERARRETTVSAADPSLSPAVILPRQQPEPRELQTTVVQPPQRIGTARTAPSFTSSPPPTYPSVAIQNSWEGTVLLRVYINVEGDVSEIQVARSSGYPVLDGAAVNAVRRWSGTPAMLDGRAAPTIELLPVRFKLRD
ncbi:MAG: energy transducer TonB [Planctomycetes bacterium]|nr:energy transducer TonB [Planctomycetota bacterium]